jgi:hypothetical protein
LIALGAADRYSAGVRTPDVETEVTADSKWTLKADSGDVAKNVDALLLMFEYTVDLNPCWREG